MYSNSSFSYSTFMNILRFLILSTVFNIYFSINLYYNYYIHVLFVIPFKEALNTQNLTLSNLYLTIHYYSFDSYLELLILININIIIII